MANVVAFKKGLRANLPASYSAGTFYVTTDERAIYLDVDDSSRIRIGDFQEFANVAALEANPNPSTTALYYVSDINCLAKWNGSKYVQINPDTDTGAVNFVTSGEGNAITSVSYDSITRTLTLTKGVKFATASEHSALATKVADLETAGGQVNVLESVKVNGNALTITDKAVDILVATGSANGTIAVNGADVAVKGLGSAAYADTTAFDAAGTASTEAGKVSSALNTYITSNDVAVSAAQSAADNAQSAADNAQNRADEAYELAEGKANASDVYTKAEANNTFVNKTDYESDKADIADAYEAADTALKNELSDAIAEKVDQTDYDAKIKALEEADADLAAKDTELASLISNNTNAITSEAAAREASDKALDERLVEVEAFFELAEGESLDDALDTLVEIQKYITSEGSAADQMTKDIAANTAAIEAEVAARKAADDTINQTITSLSNTVDTKADASDLTALAGRVTTAEGEIDTLQSDLDAAEEAIATKASASDLNTLSSNFNNYKTGHENDYTNSEIDAAIDADVKVVSDALSDYQTAHKNDYNNTQIDNKLSDVASAASSALATAKAELEADISANATAISNEVTNRNAAIANAIADLDSSAAADSGYALTGITIADGKISAKTQEKFATESYVDTQITANQLSWGSF